MRYSENNGVGADHEGRIVFQTVTVGVCELFPTVAYIEAAVDHGQLAIDADAFQGWRACRSKILAHPRSVIDLLDVVMAMIKRMIQGQVFQATAGQDLCHFAAEGHVKGDPTAAGIGQQQSAGFQVALQGGRFFRAPGEFVMPGDVKQRIRRRFRGL